MGKRAALGLIMLVLTACAATEPYVFKEREFDRDAPDFNKEPVDRSEVTICYGRMFSAVEDVAKLAETECGRFGKRAVARDEGFGACPMLTPIEAHFDCIKVGPSAGSHG